jgi:prephenate dehydrogenase
MPDTKRSSMKVVILGAGHMGSWLAEVLAGEHEIAVYDSDETKVRSLHYVLPLKSLSEIKSYGPTLLINAVSLQCTVPAFEAVLPFLTEKCVLCDVASVKAGIAAYYEGSGFRFVSVHPMFGPTFADMQAVREENAVIINESCSEGKKFFEYLFARLGLRIFEYSFDEHDQMMAYSLTIPFVSSMMFAGCVDATTAPGTTFRHHMTIARQLLSEDDHLLAEILFNPHSVTQLGRVTSQLEFLKHIIKGKDYEVAKEFFAKLRQNIVEPTGSPEG